MTLIKIQYHTLPKVHTAQLDKPLCGIGILKMQEIFKDVVGFEGLYQISNMGNLKRLKKSVYNGTNFHIIDEKINKPNKRGRDGYLVYNMVGFNGKKYNKKQHRIIAEAFIPNPDNKPCVNHINGVKDDNRIENLEWVSYKENINHAFNNGLIKTNKSVIKMDEKMSILFTYDSISSAANENKIPVGNISKVLNGHRKTAGGYKWAFLFLLITINMFSQKSSNDGADKHYLAGVAITNWAGSTAYYFGAKPFKSCLIGFGAGCLVGLGKEYIYDKAMDRGTFSKPDLTITVWGSLVGSFCLRVGIDRNQKKYNFVEKCKYERLNY